jgi:hypothetical protein
MPSAKRSSIDPTSNSPELETRSLTSSSTLTSRKRLNLDLSPATYELLQKLADDSGRDMADILRTGLALYGIANEAKAKGQSIGIIEGQKVLKNIVIA